MLTTQVHLGPGQKQVSLLVIEQLLASGGGNCGGHLGLGVQFHLFSFGIPCCDPNIESKQGVL